MLLTILKYPDPFLKEVADTVQPSDINDKLRSFINDMFETMYDGRGGGLAATQVGVKKRIFIMDGSERKDQRIVVINPEIIEVKGEIVDEEGCLSFPGIFAKIKRAGWVRIKGLDAQGESFEIESDGYLGRCIQHELDHLNGITYFDRLSPLKRRMIEKKYKKLLAEAED